MSVTGPLLKMTSRLETPVSYALPVGEESIPLNELLGSRISIAFGGIVRCIHCGREGKRSFNQGHCYPCSQKLARCDMCILKPELCHYHEGTCREPEWGEQNCLIPHTVYLANSSGLKVGITRSHQQVTRWIDQGAGQALPIRSVPGRLESGQVEVTLKQFVSDRTDWRRMLKGGADPMDLHARRDDILARAMECSAAGLPGQPVERAETTQISYPVQQYPTRIKSLGLDKLPVVEGVLQGIKGQYLLLDTGVMNVRKHQGYVCEVAV